MVYVNKNTSPSAGNNIHLMRTYPNSDVVYVNKNTSPSAGNNFHLMQDVSKFRVGLRKQRHLTFRRKQYSPYAGCITNSEVVYVNKGTSPSAGNNIHLCRTLPNSEMVYVNEVTSNFHRKQYSPYERRIQIPRWSM